jgi:amino acid transporter
MGINIAIGAGIFLVPAQAAHLVGSWAPLVCIFLGFTGLIIGLCFAEVGSRFDGTGGPYLYTRAAFGRFAAFEVGWMAWFTRAAAQASVVNGLVLALGFYWPAVRGSLGRTLVIVGLTSFLAFINVRGVRLSAWLINGLTIGKLVPLAIFGLVGLFFVNTARLVPSGPVGWSETSSAALLLLFIFSGYEVIAVPAGEARNPRATVPFAIMATVAVITVINTLVQVVAEGTLPSLASSQTPLADAAFIFMGPGGALLIGVGSVVSMTGTSAGQLLTASRLLFALGENRDLPTFFARVHPRFRTPSNAVLFSAAVTLTLALSGSFAALAAASAVARLITYLGVCTATLRLRNHRFDDLVRPATFVTPFGSLVPVLATILSLGILVGASRQQIVAGVLALVGGAGLFFAATARRNRTTVTADTTA